MNRITMLDYCKPMIANSVAWWINNTSDRYVVIFFCGLAENGVYSVASKIPSILNIFQSIFSQAWTLSAVRDFDPEDKNRICDILEPWKITVALCFILREKGILWRLEI